VKAKRFLGAVATVFLTSAAGAADVTLKALPVSATASPWSGFFIGGGLGFQASRTQETVDSLRVGGAFGLPNPLAAESEQLNGIAFRGNAFAGYDWQIAPLWVLGVEGDVGSTNQGTNLGGLSFPSPNFPGAFPAGDGIAARTTWDASARGRFGFLATPAMLVYATGGAVWQRYEISTTCGSPFCSSSFGFGPPNSFTPAVTNSAVTKAGWTIGGGIAAALGGHWFARADYRYADFGSTTLAVTRTSTVPFLNPIVNPFDLALHTHTVSFGLAYKFGDPVITPGQPDWLDPLPVKALPVKAQASPSWGGLYAGLSLGLRASGIDATTTSLFFGFPVDLTQLATSAPLNGAAFRGNPYLGWNWQFAQRWVVGIEGDVGIADHSTSLLGLSFSPGVPFNGFGAGDSLTARTTWDASLRGRVGFLVTPATLVYATAGAAWQHFEVTSTCDIPNFACGGLTPLVITNSATKSGWIVGFGAETTLSGNWFARAEYRYADFGPSSFTIDRQGVGSNLDVALRTHTATFGVAYKFGNLGRSLAAN
jgi:outer membrane immunogenic protein